MDCVPPMGPVLGSACFVGVYRKSCDNSQHSSHTHCILLNCIIIFHDFFSFSWLVFSFSIFFVYNFVAFMFVYILGQLVEMVWATIWDFSSYRWRAHNFFSYLIFCFAQLAYDFYWVQVHCTHFYYALLMQILIWLLCMAIEISREFDQIQGMDHSSVQAESQISSYLLPCLYFGLKTDYVF